MTKGIFLIAHGKRGYIYSAYNLALSIKYFDPEIKIALLHDESINYLTELQKEFFDIKIELKTKGDPGEIKTSMYEYLPFDYNLYIDADSMALSSISAMIDELISKGGYYYTHVAGLCKSENDLFPEFLWCEPKQIWDKYKLKEAVFPSVNSSWQFIKKSKESKALFAQIVKNILDPIPLNELKTQWGGTQPDELYIGAALAQKGITGEAGEYIFFSSKTRTEDYQTITDKYPILTLYGGRGFIKLTYQEWYDRLMFKYCRHFKVNHNFKTNYILPDKHVNKS